MPVHSIIIHFAKITPSLILEILLIMKINYMKKGIIAIIIVAIIIILIVLVTKNKAKDTGVEVIQPTTQNDQPNLPDNTPIQNTNSTTTTNTSVSLNTTVPITHTITYTSSGFDPSTTTINVGDTVTFINNTSSNMWVASNPHPQHTDLSEFDAGKGYAPSTSYSYTFAKTGTFTYHDHQHPSMRGTVVVE